MIDDMEQMIKEKLLQELIDRMSDAGADRMKPKGLGVEVQAADPEHLKEGLDKAKDLVGKAPMKGDSSLPDEMASDDQPSSEEDDEQRLLQLLAEDDDDEDERR